MTRFRWIEAVVFTMLLFSASVAQAQSADVDEDVVRREKRCESKHCQEYQKRLKVPFGSQWRLGATGLSYGDERHGSGTMGLGNLELLRRTPTLTDPEESGFEEMRVTGVLELTARAQVGMGRTRDFELHTSLDRYRPGKLGVGAEYTLERHPIGSRQQAMAGLNWSNASLSTRLEAAGGMVVDSNLGVYGLGDEMLGVQVSASRLVGSWLEIQGSLLQSSGGGVVGILPEEQKAKGMLPASAKRLRNVRATVGATVRLGQRLSLSLRSSAISSRQQVRLSDSDSYTPRSEKGRLHHLGISFRAF